MYAPANLLTEWSRLILGSLALAGVRDVIVSPGSRSSSLVAAALETKEFTCHSVIDERSAGFLALGLTRASGRPTLLLCTSGSALAHYFPALIEATHSELPILVLSADRPQELQQSSAPQTIHQTDLFGRYVKLCVDFGDPRADDDNLRAASRKVAQAVHVALSDTKGPVHLNFQARKPLEPLTALTPEQRSLTERVDELLFGAGLVSIPPTRARAATSAILALVERIRKEPNVLFSVGPVATALAQQTTRLAAECGIFLLCEQPGLATPVDGLARGLQGVGAQHLPTPAVVVHVGPPPISAAWQAGMKMLESDLVCVGSGEHPDPTNRASLVIMGDLEDTMTRLADALSGAPHPAGRALFTAAFERGAEAVREAIIRETALGEYRTRSIPPGRRAKLSEPAAVARILTALPAGAQLCLGNSLPVRLAAWVSPAAQPNNITVFTQRGTAGIDGLIAGAAGAALATKLPTLLLLGDVSAAHDLSSLAAARQLRSPLCICVLDNQGGRIFEHLPLASVIGKEPSWRFWVTPPELDWEAAARAYGIAYRSPSFIDELGPAVDAALKKPGPTLLVIRTDSESSRNFLRLMGPGARPPGGFN